MTDRISWRRWLLALPVALALTGCAETFEKTFGEPERLGPDASVSTGSDPEQETYPSLATVPERPQRQPSQRQTREEMRQSLASDRANARYSDEALQGRGVGAADDTPEMPEAPEPADVTTGGAANEDTRAPRELQDGETMSASDLGTSRSSAPEPAPASSTSTQRQAPQSTDLPANVPQMQQSQQGEPIQVPELPGFARSGSGSGGTSQAMESEPRRQPQDRQQAQVTVGGADATATTPPEQPAARSRTFANGDPAQTAGNVPGRRIAVIYFGHGSTALDGNDRGVLRQVARIAERREVPIRVVGHASSRTAAMGLIEHRMANFDVSMRRAETVADTLVSMGVPRERIKVEGRGDRDPVYHEFMPTGEAGNRRTEIFLGN